jgi:hypothetical protein
VHRVDLHAKCHACAKPRSLAVNGHPGSIEQLHWMTTQEHLSNRLSCDQFK